MKQDTRYKLLLVDGSALLHRAYHAYPSLTTRQGKPTGAVYGVASMLISALESEQPTEVVVAWDLPAPTFRHSLYVAYKAQRAKADEEMVEQIPTVKEVIEAMGVVQIAREGYEADDIIGTLARAEVSRKRDSSEKSEVVILSGDMDLTQLVSERVRLLTPARGRVEAKLYGVQEVEERLGVTPAQVVDYKALVGDASDNIPGVRGIGPVTAQKLLKGFGTLEEIYASIEDESRIKNQELREVLGKVRERLAENKESAYLSQELARIKCDMEIEVGGELDSFDLRGDSLKVKLEELNFRSLIRRIWVDDPASSKDSAGAGRQGELF